jgi:ribose transport system substrate-binding protein
MKQRSLALIMVGILIIAMAVGCNVDQPEEAANAASTNETQEDNSGGTEESTEDQEEVEAFKVGITIQSLENSYWAGVFGEVERLMYDKGWDFTILSCQDNSATQIQQIENFITNEVDLIMVHPSDPNAIEDYLKQARDAGILVMSWDDAMENTDLNWILDNTELGYTIGTAAAEFINEHYSEDNMAEIAIMNYPQTPILLERETGILNALEDGAPGKFTVVAQQPALDAQTAMAHMETILQANPDTKIVCSIGAGGDIGANEAFMMTTGGDIPEDMGIFSADATQQQLEAIVNEQATRASIGFEGSNKKTAEAVVDLYERLMEGEEFPEQNLVRPLTVIDESNAAEFLADYE